MRLHKSFVGLDVFVDDFVILQTPFGFVVGVVVGLFQGDANTNSFGSILRHATRSDIELYICKISVEREAVTLCRDIISRRTTSSEAVPVDVVDVEYNWDDGSVFIFTSRTSLNDADVSAIQEWFVPTVAVSLLSSLQGCDSSIAEKTIQCFSDLLEQV